MPKYHEAKLQMLLELSELDPNLMFLAYIIGTKNFGKVLKSLAGMTFTIPSTGKIKVIADKVKNYRRSFEKMLKANGKNSMLQYLAALGKLIDCKDVRTATREVVTQTVLQAYLKGLFESDEALKWAVEEMEALPAGDKLELYKLGVKELELKSNIFEKMENLSKKVKSTNSPQKT